MAKFLEGKVNRSWIANELLQQIAQEKKVNLLLLSEQYRDRDSESWYPDLLGTAAIWILDPAKMEVELTDKEEASFG